MSRPCAPVTLLLALLLAAPGPAAAQPSPEAPEVAARAVGEEALHSFNATRWQEAYELFQRADRLFHAPTLVLYMGHCKARLGDLLAARRLYRSVAEEKLPEGSPLQFQTARGVARELLASIRRSLHVIKIVIAGVPAGSASVLVDGVPVPASELEDIALDPGNHVVVASVRGGPAVRQNILASAGGETEIVLTLSPAAPAAPRVQGRAGPEAKAPVPAETAPAPPRSPRLLVPAGVAFGVGGAALIAGVVTGATSLRAAADVKATCAPGGQCPVSEQANAARAGQLADASTGTFIAAGLAVATGIVLVVVDRRGPSADAAAVGLRVGPGYVAVGGRF
jgi:hypothetical protein